MAGARCLGERGINFECSQGREQRPACQSVNRVNPRMKLIGWRTFGARLCRMGEGPGRDPLVSVLEDRAVDAHVGSSPRLGSLRQCSGYELVPIFNLFNMEQPVWLPHLDVSRD